MRRTLRAGAGGAFAADERIWHVSDSQGLGFRVKVFKPQIRARLGTTAHCACVRILAVESGRFWILPLFRGSSIFPAVQGLHVSIDKEGIDDDDDDDDDDDCWY